MKGLCRRVGLTPQGYYKGRKERVRREVEGDRLARFVREERKEHPRAGIRKLCRRAQEAGIRIGRDRMYEEMRQRDLLIKPLPRERVSTTRYEPVLPVFGNEVKGREPEGPNQMWASDITYVRTEEGFLYVSLITDMYSRKIVGWNGSWSLGTEGCLGALEKGLRKLPAGSELIHHSDRGCQYASHEYVGRLRDRGIKVSMTEKNHCAENAMAERVNGILKQEYGLGGMMRDRAQGLRMLERAVRLYNEKRLHTSLGYRTPESVHSGREAPARRGPGRYGLGGEAGRCAPQAGATPARERLPAPKPSTVPDKKGQL
ncbi:MAG: hypothetical protein RI897_1614 [Verrucomicrobiota bacterium]